MRSVIQRVKKARVIVEDRLVGEIGGGVVVLLAVGREDGEKDITYLADKIINLRIFDDKEGKMNLSLLEVGGEILAVSQFTLYGDCRKGRRPSFDEAASATPARELYEKFVEFLRGKGLKVETGEFQARMLVEIYNDGPVTFILDSKNSAPFH